VLEVVQGVPHDRQRSHCDVIKLVDERIVQSLPGKGGVKSEVVLGHYIKHVLVESVCNQESISAVSFSAMHKEEWLKEFELSD